MRRILTFTVWAAVWLTLGWLMLDAALDIAQRVTDFIAVAR